MATTHRAIHSIVIVLALGSGMLAAPPTRADASLYTQLGGADGLQQLVALLVERLYADPRISNFFVGGTPSKAREKLGAQFCDLSGGPCKTIQPDMRKVHSGLDIRSADYEAFIDVLRQAMTDRGVAADTQDRFVALLTPMRPAIVNTP